MNEEDFSTQVEDALTRFGWRWMHQRPAKTEKGWRTALSGHKGFLDYVAVRRHRLLFIELKGDTGKTSPEQDEWLNDLRECQKTIVFDPAIIKNGVASINLRKTSNVLTTPEVYLWYPKDSDAMLEILR